MCFTAAVRILRKKVKNAHIFALCCLLFCTFYTFLIYFAAKGCKIKLYRKKRRRGAVFGYVKPYRPELRVRELEEYKAVYCGLCKELGRSFGIFARFTLSYDFAFLAMLKTALDGEICPETERCNCIAHPLCKRVRVKENAALAFAARGAMISVYYKLLDDRKDEGFFKRAAAALLLPLAKKARKKALAFPDGKAADEAAAAMTAAQSALEEEKCPLPDAAAEPTAKFLGALLKACAAAPEQEAVLERFGYLLGRYVYLCDALDDVDDDRRKNRYNPFLYSGGEAAIEAKNALFLTTAELSDDFDLLKLHRYEGILENITRIGLRAEVLRIEKKLKGGDKHGAKSV